jgi:hypothetical protein
MTPTEYIIVAITTTQPPRVVIMDRCAHDTLVKDLPGFCNLKIGLKSPYEARAWYQQNRARMLVGFIKSLPDTCERHVVQGVEDD